MRDIRNLRVVFPADTRAGNWIEDIVGDQVDRLAIDTDVQGLVHFGISAAFRVASLYYGKSAGDVGSVGECLHDRGGAGETPGNVVRQRTVDERNLSGVAASHCLSQEGGGCG